MGIVRRVLREPDAELGALFQAPEDEVDTEPALPLHPGTVGSDVVLFLQLLRLQRLRIRPLDRDAMITRERVDPLLVLLRPFGQHVFGDGVHAVHVAEEMHDVLRTGQEGEIALNDDAIETVVYKLEQAAKQLVKGLHRSAPLMLASATRSSVRRLVETRSFENRHLDSDGNVRSTPSFITKGSALEIPPRTAPCTAGVLRDFKGRALGYI